MEIITIQEMRKLIKDNGYYYSRTRGSHEIYVKENNKSISLPVVKLNPCIANRLIKENNLK